MNMPFVRKKLKQISPRYVHEHCHQKPEFVVLVLLRPKMDYVRSQVVPQETLESRRSYWRTHGSS